MGREPCSVVLLAVMNYNWPHVLVLASTVLVKETLGSFTNVSSLSIFICEMGLSMGLSGNVMLGFIGSISVNARWRNGGLGPAE